MRFLPSGFRFRKTAPLAAVEAGAFAPLTQAGRCLDQWLREEGRQMSPRQHHRATALIARYFEHEEDVHDALILSFLRHYSGFSTVDLDDPQAVRFELKAVLDRATTSPPQGYLRLWVVAVTGIVATATILTVAYLSQQTLTMAQQQTLRQAVSARAQAEGVAAAGIWAVVKREQGVTRYQDIRRWDYDEALARVRAYKTPASAF